MRSGGDVLRDRVRAAVAGREPIDDAERACIEEFLERFDTLVEPFSQDADLVHVTGSAIVTGPRGVVLLQHKRLGFWLQPGGHVDPGEAPWEAAVREAREETGLDVRVPAGDHDGDHDGDHAVIPRLVHVDVHPGGRGHTHLDLRYLLDGGDRDPAPPDDESQEIGWFDWDAAIERAGDDRLKACLRSLRPSSV